ncbi:pseudouridine-5-phosphate glycosidase [Streptomyces sp. HUCO-GS316]|uniref:pseudouridine-5'-phosphate glycosidase n=1 Tax=Streptomyces sp. HUCO-GS316 TaxID=2692198 RepID=UPI00136C3F34|nr:pseudouridine-5'-phosphate glycosidase [Streptomyces sp. HUCO-GS316]MXM68979.1 pseudouridine-5-phosphate glycosidase [Streptomyces sp. HUCO-GS316]
MDGIDGIAEYLDVSDEVATALAERRPVVALESSLITASPSLELALDIEKSVRDAGAVPATVAVAGGRFLVGMDSEQIERIRSAERVRKVSARDLGLALAGGGLGATTVAGTIVIAERAGIEVFATAGIGGVHRRAQQTFDISPDLLQFTRTRMTVVSAGAKSILDARLTTEYLETAGVPVFGYGTDRLPLFYVRGGDIPVSRVDDLRLAARAVHAHWRINGGTVLLTVPVDETEAVDGALVEEAIAQALAEADRTGVAGNNVSPFLMRAVSKATGGRTAAAGRSILLGTARVAGEFAVALSAEHAATEAGR